MKKIPLSFLVFVLAVLFTAQGASPAHAAAQSKKTDSLTKNYTSAAAGISLSYPKGWSKKDTDEASTDDPDEIVQLTKENGDYFLSIAIYRMLDDTPGQSAKDFVQRTNAYKKKEKRFIKQYPLIIQKKKTDGFVVYADNDKKKSKQFYTVFPGDGAYYEVVYEVLYDKGTVKKASALFDQFLPLAKQIIQSARLSKPVEEPTAIYTNKDFGFTLQYPENWTSEESKTVRSDDGALKIVTLSSPTGTLEVTDHGKKYGSLDAFYENVLAQYQSSEDFEVVNYGPTLHREKRAYQIEYSVSSTGTKVRFFDTLISKDGSTYSLSYVAVQAGYNKYLNQAKKITRSFQSVAPDLTPDTLYRPPDSSTQFLYPSAWRIYDWGQDGMSVSSLAHPGFTINYSGGFEPTDKPDTLDAYTAANLKRYADRGYSDVRQSQTTMGGLPAGRLTARSASGESDVTVYTLKNGKSYFFNFTAPDDATRDQFLPVLESMISSFAFTQ